MCSKVEWPTLRWNDALKESLRQVGVRMMQHVYNNSKEALIKVTLFDQMMKQYTLVVLEGQPLWALTQEGYSWVSAGKGYTQEMPSLKLGDKLVHYRKHLCVVVDVNSVQPSTITDRLVHVSLQRDSKHLHGWFLSCSCRVILSKKVTVQQMRVTHSGARQTRETRHFLPCCHYSLDKWHEIGVFLSSFLTFVDARPWHVDFYPPVVAMCVDSVLPDGSKVKQGT